MMRNRMGLCAQMAASRRLRISASTAVMVPKKTDRQLEHQENGRDVRNPCSFMMQVWDPICWIKARWLRGRRTVLLAVAPSRTTRIGRLREFWTTKKMQARMIPKSSPITKSQLDYQLPAYAVLAANDLAGLTQSSRSRWPRW